MHLLKFLVMTDCNFPQHEASISIPGPAGAIEAIIVAPLHGEIKRIGIVCHPHPLYGGTMNNKVVTTIARAFRELNCAVIRFNFRGIGKSEGTYDNAKGEVNDLLAVINWAEQNCPGYPLWLAGFSFGAVIVAKAAMQKTVEKLILVAPPVNHFDFTQIKPPGSIWIIQGDKDEVVPSAEVYAWREKFLPAAKLIQLPTATHFFHGHLKDLQIELQKIL